MNTLLTLTVKPRSRRSQRINTIANTRSEATLAMKLHARSEASVWMLFYHTRWSYARANLEIKCWALRSPPDRASKTQRLSPKAGEQPEG